MIEFSWSMSSLLAIFDNFKFNLSNLNSENKTNRRRVESDFRNRMMKSESFLFLLLNDFLCSLR